MVGAPLLYAEEPVQLWFSFACLVHLLLLLLKRLAKVRLAILVEFR